VGDLGRDDRRWPPVASAPLTIEITIYGWSTSRINRHHPRSGDAYTKFDSIMAAPAPPKNP
jgi:hypothetical protein